MENNQQMSEFKQKLEAELIEWQTTLEELQVQVKLGSMEVRDKLQPEIDKLEIEMDKAKKEIAKLDDAAEQAWEELKEGANATYESLKDSFKEAVDKFNK